MISSTCEATASTALCLIFVPTTSIISGKRITKRGTTRGGRSIDILQRCSSRLYFCSRLCLSGSSRMGKSYCCACSLRVGCSHPLRLTCLECPGRYSCLSVKLGGMIHDRVIDQSGAADHAEQSQNNKQ